MPVKPRETKKAFAWIVGLLRRHHIPFHVSGGLAANIYGSNRELADIDIEVHDSGVLRLEKHVKKHIIFGPKNFRDKQFDLLLMTLNYQGQDIDICGIDSQKIFDKQAKKWVKEKIDFTNDIRKKVYHLIVPVICLKDLIRYKQKISRKVDIIDLKALKAMNSKI